MYSNFFFFFREPDGPSFMVTRSMSKKKKEDKASTIILLLMLLNNLSPEQYTLTLRGDQLEFASLQSPRGSSDLVGLDALMRLAYFTSQQLEHSSHNLFSRILSGPPPPSPLVINTEPISTSRPASPPVCSYPTVLDMGRLWCACGGPLRCVIKRERVTPPASPLHHEEPPILPSPILHPPFILTRPDTPGIESDNTSTVLYREDVEMEDVEDPEFPADEEMQDLPEPLQPVEVMDFLRPTNPSWT